MERIVILEILENALKRTEGNQVCLEQGNMSILLFDHPEVGFADAEDPLFRKCKNKEVIGEEWMAPNEWLAEAKTVVSLFFPFTERIKGAERMFDPENTSEEWLYGRVEGQAYIEAVTKNFLDELESNGIRCCAPSVDPRFQILVNNTEDDFRVVSRWSERHAAYICGLGTFSLTKAIITKRGCAGRFSSLIIDRHVPATERVYTEIYQNCIMCGACIRRCPVCAISFENGKNNLKCRQRLDDIKSRYAPRYGCGKCQTGVPCESKNPLNTRRRKGFDQ